MLTSAKLCANESDRVSPYAQEGTDAHALCEARVLTVLGRSPNDPAENLDYYNAEIYDGDLLVVRRTSDAKNGQSVIALLEDGKTICRVYKTGENGSYLEAASSKQSAEAVDHDVLPAGKWTIYGIVDFVIHAPV